MTVSYASIFSIPYDRNYYYAGKAEVMLLEV